VLVDCRAVNDHENIRVVMGGERLFNLSSHRTKGCLSNMLIPCGARTFTTQCEDAYTDPETGESHRGVYYWGSGGATPRWPSFVRLLTNTAQIRLRSGQSSSVIDAKNAVLAHIATGNFIIIEPGSPIPLVVDFRQLDYVSHQPNGIGHADHWRRDADLRLVSRSSLPIAYSYPNSYLRQSGCRVDAQLRIRAITMEMSLIAQRLRVTNRVLFVIPHARFHIRAECVLTATIASPEPCTVSRPWIAEGHEDVVTIDNSVTGQYPEVRPQFEDIIFVDDRGRTSEPPVIVDWWGMLGTYSTPPTGDIWAGRPDDGQADLICGNLRQALNGLSISGWPSYDESLHSDPNQIYAGRIGLGYL
jgi:hypothetical protein